MRLKGFCGEKVLCPNREETYRLIGCLTALASGRETPYLNSGRLDGNSDLRGVPEPSQLHALRSCSPRLPVRMDEPSNLSKCADQDRI